MLDRVHANCWPDLALQGIERTTTQACGQIKAKSVHMKLFNPITKAIYDKLRGHRIVCIDCVAASRVNYKLLMLLQIHLIIGHAINAAMAKNVWIDIRTLRRVIVHHI